MFRNSIAIVLLVGVGMLHWSGCLEPREQAPLHTSNCTTCHGSPARGGDELLNAAPPFDLAGNTSSDLPGVGAHAIHLSSDGHAPVACGDCHVVPAATDSPGHADTALPAEVVFAGLAQHDGHAPSYSDATCSDTYCHRGHTATWIPPATPVPDCVGCHGLPPEAPHPQSAACHLCHAEVVDETGFIAPLLHVDGTVQVNERCDGCHGSGELGAPPPDLSGHLSSLFIGVGAHETHLDGTASSRAVACDDCHLVPSSVSDAGHLDSTPNAELLFAGVAVANGSTPSWNRDTQSCSDSWCHRAPSPRWTDGLGLSCTGCHGMPPSAPHPQLSNCAQCHGDIISAQGVIVAPQRHVDGVIDVSVPDTCNSCHGSAVNAAPPSALDGSTATSDAGVGAHQIHLVGTGRARPVACSECHQVPETLLDSGHVDTAGPAEVIFSGVAKAFSASPSYDGAACSETWCHGGVTAFGFPSGGSASEPIWTLVDGTQSTCGGCHALPPPTPGHPPGPLFCGECHTNVTGLTDFIDPLLHVNGTVDF